MPEKQNINLQVGGYNLAMSIDPEHEPFYRDAAEQLNQRYKQYAAAFPKMSVEQLWIYVALSMAVNLQSDARDKNLQPVIDKIRELNKLISDTLIN